jgi:predicted nucleic acid-binding protein
MLIDSNILIYALNQSSPKHQVARLFLRTSFKEAVVAVQNILEVTRVMSHPVFPAKLPLKTVVRALDQVVKAMRIIYPNEETYYVYQRLLKKYDLEGNRVFDVYLAATALTNGVYELATDNEKHFGMIDEIKVINPFK